SGKDFAAKGERVKVDQDLELNVSMEESSRVSDSHWQTANNQVSRNALSGEDISLAQFEQHWTEAVRGQSIFSSPVVNEDTIITTSDQGYVEAYDLDTGEA